MKFLFYGIIQGLTEFLPISSSGHLYILKKIFSSTEDLLPFFVYLHIPTLLVICIFFSKEIRLLFNRKLVINIIIISAITAALGLALNRLNELFESKYLVGLCLLINGAILLSARANKQKSWQDISLKDSFFIGLLQGFSPLPGISRSGITITGLLRRGFAAEEAFKLSFLMAIPVIIGVFILKFKEITASQLSANDMILGFVSAFFSGLLALKIIKKTLLAGKFKNFGYYCLAVSIMSVML